MDLNPPLLAPLDLVSSNYLDTMEGVVIDVVKCLRSLGERSARKDEDEDTNHNDDSLSSFNQTNFLDFFKSAQKNADCVSPISNNNSKDLGQPP